MGFFDFLKFEKRDSAKIVYDVGNILEEAKKNLYIPGQRERVNYGLDDLIRYGYEENPHGRAVIDYIAGKLSQVKSVAYIEAEDGSLEKAPEDDPLAMMLKKPNEKQSGVDFSYEAHVQYNLLGNHLVYQLIPSGDIAPSKIYNMPAQRVEIITGGWREPVRSYTLDIDRAKKEIPAEVVAHRKQYNPLMESDGTKDLFGLPKMKSLARTIRRSNNSYDASIAAFENGMPALILSPDMPNGRGLTPSEQADMEKAWKKRFGGGKNHQKVLRSSIKINADVVGLSPVELELLKSNDYDLVDVCRVFSVPSVLVSDKSQSKHDVFTTAKVEFWENVGIPQLSDYHDCLNQTVGARYSEQYGKRYKIWYDLRDIAALQENMKEKQDRFLAELNENLITFGEYHQKMGQEVPDSPHMALYKKDLNANNTSEQDETI